MFKKISGKSEKTFFFLFVVIGLAVAIQKNIHENRVYKNKEIFSDKAAYYIYLPATFIYHWDESKFPKGLDTASGGYRYSQEHKLFIKMTCGVAVMWAPFFLTAYGIASLTGVHPNDGFSLYYQYFAVIPGVIFMVLGLFFLRRFLLRYFSPRVTYITIALLFLGTNIFYYGIDDGLMSHINSFFLFCFFLFLLGKFIDKENPSVWIFVGLAFTFALSVLIRPTNILILLPAFLIDVNSLADLKIRAMKFLKVRNIVLFCLICFIVFIPQMLYWKYLSGHYLFYSYEIETFRNWRNPPLMEFWFAPLNGLFLFTPFALFIVAGMVFMIIKRQQNGILLLLLFLLTSYIFSSWHMWHFGCGLGSRPMVEFYAFYSIALAYLLKMIINLKNHFFISIIWLLISITCFYNIRISYRPIWLAYSSWAWDDFLQILDSAGLYKYEKTTYTYINDFEFLFLGDHLPHVPTWHSKTLAAKIIPEISEAGFYKTTTICTLNHPLRYVEMSLWVNQEEGTKTGIVYQMEIRDWNDSLLYKRELPVDNFIKSGNSWYEVKGVVPIPGWLNQSSEITVKIINPYRSSLLIDDEKISFH